MRMTELILRKRSGESLTCEEIAFWIDGVTAGTVPDYQSAALLMAICWRGMDPRETADLTLAMARSGVVVDLSAIPGVKVDKHSTGGVGDTTTLIVAPVVASCGVPVAKMSGRGLGHTGGTLDKLESIAGVSVERGVDELIDMVNQTGIAVIGQSGDIVPADRALYALRDVTGTIDSLPLIASSIMSKKIAAGSDAIVLDVKTGSGAFMQTPDEAFALAAQMVDIGRLVDRKTVAVVTDMDQPLGMQIGNQLEVQEAIEALNGRLPPNDPLIAVSRILATHMLLLGGAARDPNEAARRFDDAIASGAAKEKLRTLITSLGGDGTVVDHPERLATVKRHVPFFSPADGVVTAINALAIGACAQRLGAGRAAKTDVIDPAVGLVMAVRIGDRVAKGQPLLTLYVNDDSRLEAALGCLEGAFVIDHDEQQTLPTDRLPDPHKPLVLGVVDENGAQRFTH